MTKRILVTGGGGFIGSHTVQLLLEKDCQVIVLDNLSSGKLVNLDLKNPNLEFVEGDVLELPLVEDLVKNCDAVLHLAAIASVPQTLAYPIYSFQVNTQGFLHVLEAIRLSKKEMVLVYASSAAVYGDSELFPLNDENNISSDPLSPYALQKRDMEYYAKLYHSLYGINSLGLRYFNVYGPNQDPSSPYSGVISRFLDSYRAGSALTVFGDGMQVRDFIYVGDVARANYLSLHANVQGAVNIATGEKTNLLELIEAIEKAGRKKALVKHEAPRSGDIKTSFAKVDLAKQLLGFRATIFLEDGIARTYGRSD